MLFTPRETKAAVKRLNATFDALNTIIVDRKQVLRQLKFAVLTREHLLLEGPPGAAKSYLAKHFLRALEGASTFSIACTKKMTEEYLVGPLDMRLFRDEGIYFHRTEGTLVDADYAFVDEIFDLTPNTARALLEVLNERTFSRGTQHVKAPLKTAIAATNFSGEDARELDAVLDRFLFKAKVGPLSDVTARMTMLRLKSKGVDVPKIEVDDLRRLQAAVARVNIPDPVLSHYVQLCAGLKITDRFMANALSVLRAGAVLAGRLQCTIEDISNLDTCFTVAGDQQSEQVFASSMKSYAGALQAQDLMSKMTLLNARSVHLRRLAAVATDYDGIKSLAVEAEECRTAAKMWGVATAATPLRESTLTNLATVTEKADQLYILMHQVENSADASAR